MPVLLAEHLFGLPAETWAQIAVILVPLIGGAIAFALRGYVTARLKALENAHELQMTQLRAQIEQDALQARKIEDLTQAVHDMAQVTSEATKALLADRQAAAKEREAFRDTLEHSTTIAAETAVTIAEIMPAVAEARKEHGVILERLTKLEERLERFQTSALTPIRSDLKDITGGVKALGTTLEALPQAVQAAMTPAKTEATPQSILPAPTS